MHLAARLMLALLPPPEKAVWYALFALALPLMLLALLFAGPAVIHERVPLATPGQVQWYIDGAAAASDATRTVCNQAGLQVDWQPLLAIDAVLLRQDFSRSSRARAEALARRFIERIGATRCNCRTDEGGGTRCDTAPTYRVRPLDEVLDGLARETDPAWHLDAQGRAKVADYLAFDRDVLRDVGTE